jgi:MFS family permease
MPDGRARSVLRLCRLCLCLWTKVSGASRDFLLIALLVATGLSAVTIPLSGYISDRIGRKRMYLISAVSVGVFAFVYFAMMNSMVPGLIFLAIVLSFTRTT